jgi:phosphatidate cytidylyltransferase
MKREREVKDSGTIFPGHGGVLDRFDSLLFVMPALYFILKYIPVFV